jgi:hypothetical protein
MLEFNMQFIMLRKDLPIGSKTIMAIWLFKQRQFPNSTLSKHKALICAHGGQQTWGQDYWDTYVPVVTWASIHLLLIVAKIHGLQLKSIDFVLAFPQADWMYQSTWNYLLASIQSMFQILIAIDTSSSLTKASMYSSKQDSIGSKNYERDSSLKTLLKSSQ